MARSCVWDGADVEQVLALVEEIQAPALHFEVALESGRCAAGSWELLVLGVCGGERGGDLRRASF